MSEIREWKVELLQGVSRATTITVQARDADEARAAAQRVIEDGTYPDDDGWTIEMHYSDPEIQQITALKGD